MVSFLMWHWVLFANIYIIFLHRIHADTNLHFYFMYSLCLFSISNVLCLIIFFFSLYALIYFPAFHLCLLSFQVCLFCLKDLVIYSFSDIFVLPFPSWVQSALFLFFSSCYLFLFLVFSNFQSRIFFFFIFSDVWVIIYSSGAWTSTSVFFLWGVGVVTQLINVKSSPLIVCNDSDSVWICWCFFHCYSVLMTYRFWFNDHIL